VKELRVTGFQCIESNHIEIDYSLFKGLINAMKWFYSRMALLLLILLATAGTSYIYIILKKYYGNHVEVYV
jgi:hypothetical protein